MKCGGQAGHFDRWVFEMFSRKSDVHTLLPPAPFPPPLWASYGKCVFCILLASPLTPMTSFVKTSKRQRIWQYLMWLWVQTPFPESLHVYHIYIYICPMPTLTPQTIPMYIYIYKQKWTLTHGFGSSLFQCHSPSNDSSKLGYLL